MPEQCKVILSLLNGTEFDRTIFSLPPLRWEGNDRLARLTESQSFCWHTREEQHALRTHWCRWSGWERNPGMQPVLNKYMSYAGYSNWSFCFWNLKKCYQNSKKHPPSLGPARHNRPGPARASFLNSSFFFRISTTSCCIFSLFSSSCSSVLLRTFCLETRISKREER